MLVTAGRKSPAPIPSSLVSSVARTVMVRVVLPEQGDLAEPLAGTHGADDSLAVEHVDAPLLHDVEAVARVAGLEHGHRPRAPRSGRRSAPAARSP